MASQQKRHFLIAFERPDESCNTASVKKTACGLWIAWDAETTQQEAITAACRLSKHCGRVLVFVGKDLGKLHAEYVQGELVG